jgi:hypothetical protein
MTRAAATRARIPHAALEWRTGSGRWRYDVTLIEMFQAQLEAEAKRTRGALERVPEGKDDWTPHPKSMPLGRLAMLVARMPTWFGLIVNQDDLELNPPDGGGAGRGARRRGRAGAKSAARDHRRAARPALAPQGFRQRRQRRTAARRDPRHLRAPRAPSRPAHGLPALEQRAGARDIRAVCRRPTIRISATS